MKSPIARVLPVALWSVAVVIGGCGGSPAPVTGTSSEGMARPAPSDSAPPSSGAAAGAAHTATSEPTEGSEPPAAPWGQGASAANDPPSARGAGGLGSGAKGPSLRAGEVTVKGRLLPEVIQRIVRQNFGRFRMCYENGLRGTPKLQGRVTVGFTIESLGTVSGASDSGSDLPDPSVVSCVVRGFSGLSFPSPEGGVVKVTYPLLFAPGE